MMTSEPAAVVMRRPRSRGSAERPAAEQKEPLLIGVSLEKAAPGKRVAVGTKGAQIFPPADPEGPANAAALLDAARASGIEVPARFIFEAGQIFYEGREIAEVRLSGFYEATPRLGGGVEAKRWISEEPPRLSVDEQGFIVLDEADRDRTHLCARAIGDPAGEGIALSFLWDLAASTEPLPLPQPAPAERETIGLSFGFSLADVDSMDLIRQSHHVRFLRRDWSRLPRWEQLVDKEKRRILQQEGEDAFVDLRQQEKDPEARGPLLKKRYSKKGPVISLTGEAQQRLRICEGLREGFRERDPSTGEEYIVRLYRAGSGFLEVALNLGGARTDEWAKATLGSEDDRQLDLFGANSRARHLRNVRDVIEAVYGQIFRQHQNPVVIPARAFRTLFAAEDEKNWKQAVDRTLQALVRFSFKLEAHDMSGKLKGGGVFLAHWLYDGRGAGDHGEGLYYLEVTNGFLGCLRAFESDKWKLRADRELTHFSFRRLNKEQRQALGWGEGRETKEAYVHIDAGSVFYNAAAGLTPRQKNLVGVLESELTLRRDPTTRARSDIRLAAKDKDAGEPRLYGSDFCPLLPKGKSFHGALGHFAKNPEVGRSLRGTARRAGKSGGAHHEGLLRVLGYQLPRGPAVFRRKAVVGEALEDFKAVVVDYLGGIVAVKMGDEWKSFDDALSLPEHELLDRSRFYFFLPEDWRQQRRAKWEEATGYRATEDEAEARKTREELAGDAAEQPGKTPLRHRLRKARMERRLKQIEVGKLFGVSQTMVWKWEVGPEKGKPIPAELVPLVQRWIETAQAPSKSELEARKTTRSGVRKEAARSSAT